MNECARESKLDFREVIMYEKERKRLSVYDMILLYDFSFFSLSSSGVTIYISVVQYEEEGKYVL